MKAFLHQLVKNLLEEGNALYREWEYKAALAQYVEALNVADYAESDGVIISQHLLENLYVNRAACYFFMSAYEKALEDCEHTLKLNENNYRALYRKTRALNEMGKHKEAYDCIAKCSLAVPQDENVVKLTQELAQRLGLRIRKAYIRAQVIVCQILSPFSLVQGRHVTNTPPSVGLSSGKWDTASLLHVALRGAPGWVVPPLTKNPLVETHDLRQACNMCFIKSGSKAFDYTYNPELDHKCKNDLLIGRLKVSADPRWKKIRPRPTKNNYAGPYYICKDIASKEDCKYGDNCTFAYCPEEIDVWTLERKGAINRELLFDPLGGSTRSSLTVAKILKDHLGLFIFLCEECFDSKPRLISQRNKASPAVCSNLETSHKFDTNKCMVHMLRTTTVNYCKIRQFKDYCQFDVCRHEVRYGCLREDSCNFAHSLVELKVWVLQQNSAISHEEIVQEGKQYWQSLEASRAQVGNPVIGKSPSLDMKMKFVCGQCWRNGQVIEPDKTLKYCSAKARHGWTKERRVLLVMSNERKKWVSIRPLPPCKSQPQQYDLCLHVTNGKKCQYIGNCSFAHSIEEREVWTYMKENNMHDMQQMHDMWLKNQNPMKTGEATVLTTRQTEKQIHMPTDYAEPGMGYHCWLCGKNSNSEKQWKKHITSEKHKEKVFNSEDDQNCWQYRFPMGEFKLLKNKPCSDGEACPFAHCQAELDEWLGRKDLLQMKLAKAAKDKLIATNDSDFGKYTFLMKDLN
uniref:Zinc finger CCCH-type containing 7B n=1 Tax=Callorhinchus milii TaxID=7868 RepID=A0A4W3H489_CALMI